MSDKVDPTSSSSKADPNSLVKSGDKKAPSNEFDAKKTLSNNTLGALENEAPEVMEMLKKAIAERIRSQMEKSQKRMKEINREHRRLNS